MAKETGTLYVVATPIGNLEDITLRALRILLEVDLIACEDTRVTKKLLKYFDIETPTVSYHQHSGKPKTDNVIKKILEGENVALVTDAGTPGISDPGNILVEAAAEEDIKAVPIPGASALTALASVSGINMQKFVFLGFPPNKKGREKFFKELIEFENPVMYYDSPHRAIKNFELFSSLGGKDFKLIVWRELTKMFEEIVRGSVEEVLEYFSANEDKVRGEFVVIVT